MAAVQRNGGELAYIFDRTVPSQAVVHFGNHAQVYPVSPCLHQHVLDDSALTRGGEENLIHKLFSRMLEERFQRSDDIACGGYKARTRAGKVDEPFECVTKMPNAFQVMAESMRLDRKSTRLNSSHLGIS